MRGTITSPVTGEQYSVQVLPEVYGESVGMNDPRYRDDCGSQVIVTHERSGWFKMRWVDSLSIALGGERDAMQAMAERMDAEWQAGALV